MNADTKRLVIAHLCMAGACTCWGLMAPFGKDAMTHGLDGIDLATMRIVGGAILFWLTSFFVKKEKVPNRDKFRLAGAGLFGLGLNQGCFTVGLSLTSPVNASIITTSLPIFAMILSAIILKERLTKLKVNGVLLGCIGAIILVLASANAENEQKESLLGDLLCM